MKSYLKNYSLLVKIKRKLWSQFNIDGSGGTSNINVLTTFPLYLPISAGEYHDRARLAVQAINQTIPFMRDLVKSVQDSIAEVIDIRTFPVTERQKKSVEEIKVLFDEYGSDKANYHNYHYLYGSILSDPTSVKNIFEIGLGTNNTDVVSNMGVNGRPGASLRAFRDYCPEANIYGADIDKRILFSEERIKTFYVDQTSQETFHHIEKDIPRDFDLVIDDGLHTPNANIASLEFALKIVKVGGWVVIEDIDREATPLWQVVASILPSSKYKSYIFNAAGLIVFAVRRIG